MVTLKAAKADSIFGSQGATKNYVKAQITSGELIEGTAVKSTGETNTKFLRADGDNTSSWQPVAVESSTMTYTNRYAKMDSASAISNDTSLSESVSASDVRAKVSLQNSTKLTQAWVTAGVGVSYTTYDLSSESWSPPIKPAYYFRCEANGGNAGQKIMLPTTTYMSAGQFFYIACSVYADGGASNTGTIELETPNSTLKINGGSYYGVADGSGFRLLRGANTSAPADDIHTAFWIVYYTGDDPTVGYIVKEMT